MLIGAIDAGRAANFGWAIAGGASDCGSPAGLITAIVDALKHGDDVALGIEAPLWVPIGRSFENMTRSRGGIERSSRRAWSAGAGCGALAVGTANLAWVLEELHRQMGARMITTQVDRATAISGQLLIWEAFVSAAGKPSPRGHEVDAHAAATAFAAQWPAIRSLVPLAPAVNLAWAVATATGHSIRSDEAMLAVPVVGPL